MKNSLLIIMICFFLFQGLNTKSFRKSSSLSKRTSGKSTTKASKSKHIYPTQYVNKLTFTNKAIFAGQSIAVFENDVWLCGLNGKVYRHSGFNAEITGSAPTDCKNIAVNRKGTLLVATKSKKLYVLNKIQSKTAAWFTINSPDIEDISIGLRNEIYFIDTKGVIYGLNSYNKTNMSYEKFNKTEFGAKCRIMVDSNTNSVLLINSLGELYRVTSDKQTRLLPTIFAEDACVDADSNIYLASRNGILKKQRDLNDFNFVERGIAKRIACHNSVWIIGYDDSVYSGA